MEEALAPTGNFKKSAAVVPVLAYTQEKTKNDKKRQAEIFFMYLIIVSPL